MVLSATRWGEEDWSLIRCVLPFWSLSLRLDLRPLVIVVRWFLILVYWVRFFSLRYVSFFLSTSISVWLHCPLVSDFSILGFGLFVCFFFFFFWRIRGFATVCNLLGLLYLFFFFKLGLLYHMLFRIDVGLFFLSGLALLQFFFFFRF